MLLEAEGRKMHSTSEHLRLGQDTNTAYTINLHLHVRIAVWVSQVSQMRPPGCILCIAFNNDCILVQRISQGKSSVTLLPAVQVIRLLAA